MASRFSPTVRRRRLGRELRRLREEAGLKLGKVASVLECSPSTVSRIENGQVGNIKPRNLRELLELYVVGDDQQEKLLRLAYQARAKDWWEAYGDVADEYVSVEAGAATIRSYEALLVPGLLQTEEYARAVIRKVLPDAPDDAIEKRVELRMARQSHLFDDDPVRLWVVVEEAVLHKLTGGRSVMRDQLHRLVLAAEQPTVTLQVLPLSVGEYPEVEGSFTILGFADPDDPPVVNLEQSDSFFYLETAEAVDRYMKAFERLQAAAREPPESSALLAGLWEGYRTAPQHLGNHS